MQPNHRGARRVFQDGREELSQVKPWAPPPPQPLLHPENSARKEAFGRRSKRTTFSAPSRLILSFWRGFGKPAAAAASLAKAIDRALQLVPKSLLMPVRLHAFAALVLGNFCFPSFFKRAHSDFSNCDSIESSNSPQCKRSRRLGYLVSCEGPAAAFFLSCVPMPIFFKNGSIDCLRPRNFSIDSLTSRESPGS